ncbi:MAG: metalloregulator ArsR/SmtB family transcription factor [Thermoleophilia bacterium]|nr:metalloregulator ArsR/SmtB family transcription factor [Thermoleophilia bacterium]MDH4339702.1 metalloregulator ArsR/SmtB family transcription factor [Thermoleophilia bacterium]MDH5280792.1 metalloregulator ArsR/SmtB family transcription factor [Thermoleophilia bacterium]
MPTNGHPLDALGDPTRRQVFELLRGGPRSVGELAAELPVSRPAVSQHLRVLEGACLVTHRREGTRHLYELDRSGVATLRDWVDGFWDEALARFKAAAETKGNAP